MCGPNCSAHRSWNGDGRPHEETRQALVAADDHGDEMKIRRITATPINLKLEAPYVWVFGELDGFSPTIVEVETEDGLTGLGEAPSPAAAAIITDHLAPRLIGRDAFDIAGAEHV